MMRMSTESVTTSLIQSQPTFSSFVTLAASTLNTLDSFEC